MDVLNAFLYGLIEGLTEFLSVSQSGHLAILKDIFGLQNFDGANLFILFSHLGILSVICVMYRYDIRMLAVSFAGLVRTAFTKKTRYRNLTTGEKLFVFILIASCPLAAAVLLYIKIQSIEINAALIGMFLIVNAAVLFLSDKFSYGYKTIKSISYKNAFNIGLCQIAAVLPGISHLSVTSVAGLLNAFTPAFAVKFSFLTAVPVILGKSVFAVVDFVKSGESFGAEMIVPCAAGFCSAFVGGFIAMTLFRALFAKRKLYIISIYCFIMGVIAVIGG